MFVVQMHTLTKPSSIRVDGHLNYAQGSSFGDVLCVPEAARHRSQFHNAGLNYGTEHYAWRTRCGLKGYVDGILKNPPRALHCLDSRTEIILAAYLGLYLRNSVRRKRIHSKVMESLGINLDDYVDLVSWTHLPYYEEHPVEVGDNWRWEEHITSLSTNSWQ